MAIHDYNIGNGSGLDVRTDLNAVLAAILSQNSSATEPTTIMGGMFWYDTTNSLFKQRNNTNDGWNIKWDTTKGQLATLYSPTFGGQVDLPTTTFINGNAVATLVAPIFSGNAVFEKLTAWSDVSLPASTTIGGVSPTELSYLDGVTSSIQSQLNGKQATLVSGTNIKTVNGQPVLGSGDLVIQADRISTIFANSQTFTVSGTFTVPANINKVMVVGGHAGGGGGGGGGGTTTTYTGGDGGGGGAGVLGSPKIVAVTPSSAITVTIGAGGSGGAPGTTVTSTSGSAGRSGGSGGATSFGTLCFNGASGGGGGAGVINGITRGGGGGGGAAIGGMGGTGGAASGAGGSATRGLYETTVATGGLINSGGAGTGGTSLDINGNNGANTTVGNGGAGGSGGSGKVIVYW